MQELFQLLRAERRVLETLCYRLTVTRHLVASGESRFLRRAATELADAAQRLREASTARAGASMRQQSRMAPGRRPVTLRSLIDQVPEGDQAQLLETRVQLAGALDEVEELVTSLRNFVHRNLEEIAALYALGSDETFLRLPAQPMPTSGRLSPAVVEDLAMSPQLTTLAATEQGFQTVLEALGHIDLSLIEQFLAM